MKCTSKEWDHCRVEKMGCDGCHYNEIIVGEYVRTDRGIIKKITSENTLFVMKFANVCCYGNIVKHSKSIIDLIEVGDILELREYIDIFKKSEKLGVSDWSMLNEISQAIKEKKIELISILTHEQYEANCFRLEVQHGSI